MGGPIPPLALRITVPNGLALAPPQSVHLSRLVRALLSFAAVRADSASRISRAAPAAAAAREKAARAEAERQYGAACCEPRRQERHFTYRSSTRKTGPAAPNRTRPPGSPLHSPPISPGRGGRASRAPCVRVRRSSQTPPIPPRIKFNRGYSTVIYLIFSRMINYW